MIVLPDSGGLVLPLANGGFLVGLLIVERWAGAPAGAGGGPVPPSAAFGAGDVALVKQAAAVLALACAMDLRGALERAGQAVRQRQLRGLVRQVSRAGGRSELRAGAGVPPAG